ncbi:hypothetical protein NB689_000311 [Xanthomonas sacchari]|nr:hypothetical protein [Xanthomonas sacchari]
MRLFRLRLAAVEHPRLAVVVGEALGTHAALGAIVGLGAVADEAARGLARAVGLQRAGFVGDAALGHAHLHVAVALHVGERALRRVDRQLVEVGPAQAAELGVQVREQAALQQRVVGEVDAGHDVGRAVRHLLGFGEEVVRPAVQHHAPDDLQRHQFLRDQLGGVQVVEREGVGLFLGEQLHAQFPFREVAAFDRLEQVAAVEVRVGAGQLHRLVPDRGLQAELRPPVELDEGAAAFRVEQAEAVDAEAFHHAQRARDGAVAHRPHDHVQRFGHQRDEVPECVVRAGRLRKAAVRLHLHRVDQVGELQRVLDEEHRDVVAHQVPVAFLGVELDREAAHVAWRVHRAGAAGDGGEAGEHRRLHSDLGEQRGGGVLGQRLGQFEVAMCGAAARVHDAFGNALVIEVGDLFAQDEVFQQRRPARGGAQRVLVVGDRNALVGGQRRMRAAGLLVQFVAMAALIGGRGGGGEGGGRCGIAGRALAAGHGRSLRCVAEEGVAVGCPVREDAGAAEVPILGGAA